MLREIRITPMTVFMVRVITIATKEKFSFMEALDIVFTEFAIDGFSSKHYREMKELIGISHKDGIIREPADELLRGIENAKLALSLQDEVIRELEQNYTRETYDQLVISLSDGDVAMPKKFEKLLGSIVKLMSYGYALDHILTFFLPASFTTGRGTTQVLSQGWHNFIQDLFDKKFDYKSLPETEDVLPMDGVVTVDALDDSNREYS